MDIVAINIENKKLGRVWNFESDFGAFMMMGILELHLGDSLVCNYFEDKDETFVLFTNEQLQTILDNSFDEPSKDLFLRDIWYLKTGEMLFEQTEPRPGVLSKMMSWMKLSQ